MSAKPAEVLRQRFDDWSDDLRARGLSPEAEKIKQLYTRMVFDEGSHSREIVRFPKPAPVQCATRERGSPPPFASNTIGPPLRELGRFTRVVARHASTGEAEINGRPCYAVRLAERRAYFGLFCLWRQIRVVRSEHKNRLDVVASTFLRTGKVPVELVV